MKVLFPFRGDSCGGSHRSAAELAVELRRLGVEIVLGLHDWIPPYGNRLEEMFSGGAVRLPRFPSQRTRRTLTVAGRAPSISPRLRRAVEASGVSIVHTHDREMHLVWTWTLRRLDGVVHVWHQRNFTRSPLLPLMMRRADAVIAVSGAVAGAIRTQPKRLEVIHNPIDCARVRPPATLSRTVDIAAPVRFGFLGRLSPEKHVDHLIRAAAALTSGQPGSSEVWLMGDDRSGLRRQLAGMASRSGVEARFLGFAAAPVDFLREIDILVVPAGPREGFGRTLVEGRCAGKVVIASDVPAHREVAGILDEIHLYPFGDVPRLSELMQLQSGRLRKNPRPAPPSGVGLANFDPRHVAQAVHRLYASLSGG